MSQVRHYHIWANGRSLCDLFASEEGSLPRDGEVVLVCGPCLVAAELVQNSAHWMVQRGGQPDSSLTASLEILLSTSWGKDYDIDTLSEAFTINNYQYPLAEATEEK